MTTPPSAVDPHSFRRGPGRPSNDPKCSRCGHRRSSVIHATPVREVPKGRRPSQDVWLRVKDLCETIFPTTPEKSIREWLSSEKLRGKKIGRTWLVSESAVDEFLSDSGREE